MATISRAHLGQKAGGKMSEMFEQGEFSDIAGFAGQAAVSIRLEDARVSSAQNLN